MLKSYNIKFQLNRRQVFWRFILFHKLDSSLTYDKQEHEDQPQKSVQIDRHLFFSSLFFFLVKKLQ